MLKLQKKCCMRFKAIFKRFKRLVLMLAYSYIKNPRTFKQSKFVFFM